MNSISKNTTEPILEAVARRLRGFRGRISEMSRATGIEVNSIHRIARGENKNPCVQTIQPLIDWMDVEEGKHQAADFTRVLPWGYHLSLPALGFVLASQRRPGIAESAPQGSRSAPKSAGASS